MNHVKFNQIIYGTLGFLLLMGCGNSQELTAPEITPITATPIPSTSTPMTPTLTSIIPTVTPIPATATAEPSATLTPLNPSPRNYVSMTCDEESDRVILFGGQTGENYQNAKNINGETWVYNDAANKWTEMQPDSGPLRRAASDLAYDAESDRVLMFGGGNEITLGLPEMWSYDYNTNAWQQMASGPMAHLGAQIAYDAESDRIILFGGFNFKNGDLFNDTWAYDFNSDTWTEMEPNASPSARNYHGMAYDSESDRVILFGGPHNLDRNIWAYDYNSNTWQEMVSGPDIGPGYLDYSAMTYNPIADRIIIYGGISRGYIQEKTWEYDYNTNTWLELNPGINPGLLMKQAMVYCTAADRVIMFGGQFGKSGDQLTAKTWTYDINTNTWTDVTENY